MISLLDNLQVPHTHESAIFLGKSWDQVCAVLGLNISDIWTEDVQPEKRNLFQAKLFGTSHSRYYKLC